MHKISIKKLFLTVLKTNFVMAFHKKNIFILSLLLFIVLLITYSNHFNNGFHFDDSHTIVTNVNIRSLKNIPNFFVDTKMVSSSKDHWGLRPFVTTTLAIDYWLASGLNPFYFHLSTFLFFIALLVLMFFMFKHILLKTKADIWNPYISLLTAGLFGLHTVNAETINYIISRSDVISTFFIVLSFCIYTLLPNKRKLYIYIIPAMIGVLAKETIIVLPMLLFVYILFFEKNISIPDIFKKDNFKEVLNTFLKLIPLTLCIALVQSYTLIKTGSIAGLSNNLIDYIQTQPFVWFHYFVSFFLPFSLSADSDWTVIQNIFDDRVIAGFVFLVTLITIVIKNSKKKKTRPIAFGLIWFVFALLPTSLAPLSEVMNDHRMFFPFIGLALSIVYTISLYLKKNEKKVINNKGLLWGGISLVLLAYAYGTYQRNKVWLNGETLWYDVTIKSPKNGRGLMNYGLTQMAKGNYAVAKEYFNKSLKLYPSYSTLYINLGIVNGATNNDVKAEEYFKKAINLKPHDDSGYFFYARYLNEKNKFKIAKINSEKALKTNPYNLPNRHLLMDIYYKLELWGNLENLVNETLNIQPKDETSLKFKSLGQNKKTELTITEETANVNPTPEKYINLSLLYYNKGMYKKCIEACNKAISLNPNSAIAYNNICISYTNLGNYEEAIKACEKALEIDSNFNLAKNNLKYAQQKKQQ